MPTKAPRPATSRAAPAASLRSRPPTSTRSAGSSSSRTMSRSCRASAPKRMDTGMPVFRAVRAAPRNRLSSVGVMPVAGGRGGHEPGGAAPLDARNHHALGDLLAEEVGELLGRPRRRRVGLRRQEVAAEHLLRAHARRGDDVHAGRARQRLVQLHVAAVEHARAVDDRPPAVLAEVRQLRRPGSRRSPPGPWRCPGRTGRPGTTDSSASWTATTPSSEAGTGPRTVLTVCPVGAWNVSPVATGGV